MNKAVVVMIAMMVFVGNAFSADILGFDSPRGKVSFPHKVHQMMLKDCKKCHGKAPGKIEGFGKEWAHKNCTGCHTKMKKGPTACKDCHKK